MRRTVVVALVFIACTTRPAPAAAFSCLSPDVPPGETATLGSDMECGLVHVGQDGTFDLNGHTYTGLVMGPPQNGGKARFTIRGPGEIRAQFPDNPCVMFYSGQVVIDGGDGQVTLTSCGYGVLANVGGSRVTLRNVTMRRTFQRPMILGVQAGKVEFENVTIDHRETFDISRGDGIYARRIRGSGLVLHHMMHGLSAPSIRASNVLADDVTMAIASTRRADVTGFTSTRHLIGAYSKRLRLTDSVLSNAVSGGIDVGASRLPILTNTTCERSGTYDPTAPGSLVLGPDWGVCSLD